MATTKLWKVVKRVDHVIDYATNKEKTKVIEFNHKNEMIADDLKSVMDYVRNTDKTEKEYYVSGINCEPEYAYEEMQDVKYFYNKEDKILAFHGYQSFVEGEVTPELAHEIGMRVANEMWGDRFQVIVTTHLNTNHIHNHLLLNSVSFKDGLKYYSNRTNTAILRHTSDEICREYGLSVLEEKPCKKSKINFDNYYKKSLYNDNYSNNAKRDLDLAIRQAYSYDDFLYLMKKLDYEIILRAGKISIKKAPYKRNIRIERRFGEDYTINNIKKRILEEKETRVPFIKSYYRKVYFPFEKRHKRAKAKGFIALYYHYCYLLKVFPNNVPQQQLPASIRADIAIMEQLSNEARFLSDNRITTITELKDYIDENNFKIRVLLDKRERLWAKRKVIKNEEQRKGICNEISKCTEELIKLRKEAEVCNDIKIRTQKIDENLNELDKQEEQEKEKNKNKERRK